MRTLFTLTLTMLCINGWSQLILLPSSAIAFEPQQYHLTKDGSYIALKKYITNESGSNWNKYQFDLTIIKCDKDMIVVDEQKLVNGEKGYSSFYVELIESDKRLWLIYFDAAQGNTVGTCNAMEIDPVTLQPGTKKIIADEKEIDERLKLFDGYRQRKMIFKSSPNNKFHYLFIDNGHDEFYLSSLNEQLEPVWKNKVTIPGYDADEINDIAIDDSGTIFITSLKKSAATLSVFTTDKKVTHNLLKLDTETPTNMKLFINKKTGDIYAGGTYTQDWDYSKGVYKAILNKDRSKLENITKAVFPDTVITRLKKYEFASLKSKNYGIYSGFIRCKLLGHDNGNLHIVIECRKIVASPNSSANIAGSLISVNFSPAHTTFSYLPRTAVRPGDDKKSDQVFASTCNQKLFFAYLDESSNIKRSLDDEPKVLNGKNNVMLVSASIEMDGTIRRKEIPLENYLHIWGSIRLFLEKECQ